MGKLCISVDYLSVKYILVTFEISSRKNSTKKLNQTVSYLSTYRKPQLQHSHYVMKTLKFPLNNKTFPFNMIRQT